METLTSTAADILSPDGIATIFSQVAHAFQTREWNVLFGILLTVAVALTKRFGLFERFGIPTAYIGWAAMGLAALGSIGTGLLTGADWAAIASAAVTTGLTAIGVHEMSKPLRKPSTPSEPPSE